MKTTAALALAIVGCAPAATPVASIQIPPTKSAYLWIEAESPTKTNFPPSDRHAWVPADAAQAAVLSEGKWLGADGNRPAPLFAEYAITLPEDGTYQLFARKFWKHGPYRWRIDDGPWQTVTGEVALLDDAPIRQHLVANWTAAGGVSLKKGAHTLRIETTSNEGAIAFDVFLLTKEPFTPRGKMKPGEKYNRAPEGFFPFEPDPDPFRPTPLDLRSLNEKFAGEHGVIQAKGEEFVHAANGQPVRFWAHNTGNDALLLDDASLALMARSLAKQGVNLIRLHGPVWGDDWTKADPQHVRNVHRFVRAMKKEGIYVNLSIYFPLWMQPQRKDLAGYNGQRHPFAAHFFNPDFIRNYRNWWKGLLTTPDATTGKSLAEEPAVAMVEMLNEDSYFFWTFTPYENIPAEQMAILERLFGDWLARKYGSVAKAFQTWGGDAKRGDDAAAGRAGFRPLWEMANVKDARSKDTVAFLTDHQRKWFDATYAYLRNDLKYRGLITGSNWITADPRVLGPLDKWTNAGADFMDRHGYFDQGHQGEGAGYSIRPGHTFTDVSALTFPGGNFSLPIFDIRYDNKPSTISELNWTPPNRLRADLPLVSAAYGLLQGSDALFFFASAAPSWEGGMGKFGLRTPVIAGQYPATAYLFRKGLVKPGPVAVEANLTLAKLLNLEGAPVTAPQNLDQLRAADVPGQPKRVESLGGIDPLTFLVGKVAVNFTPSEKPSSTINLGRYIDRDAKRVKSATGELTWDYGQGLVTVDSPMAQGLTGFLSKSKLSTTTVEADLPLDYGSLVLVSLDGKPIRESGRILLQIMSQESVYGFQTTGMGKLTITDVGSAPLVVKKFRGTVSLKRSDAGALKVTALDANGYPRQKLGGAAKIDLLEDAMYYLIEK
ncbi:MAG: hypothetical protein ACO1SV_00220 [Fimbriimonas sp.]